MAIAFLRRNEIDEDRWNTCIDGANLSLPYAYSFYLDVVAPEWAGLVYNNYEAVMPLPLRRKMGIYYVFQPLLCPQLGIFSLLPLNKEIKLAFAKAIPQFIRYIDYSIHHDAVIDNYGSYQIKDNYELNLSRPYLTILKAYKYDTRRSIKLSQKQPVHFEHNIAHNLILQLCQQTNQQMNDWFDQKKSGQFIRLMQVLTERQLGFSLGIADEHNNISATVFYIKTKTRIINLINASTPVAKKNNWMTLLINQVIQLHSGQAYIFDFEGSNIPSIAKFFRNFGAEKTNYYAWNWNRLPFSLKWK